MNSSQASTSTLSATNFSQPVLNNLITESTTPNPDLSSASQPKRRPGRPKGSGPKQHTVEVKIKRPVGRPRKDGLPAGSVEAPRRPKKHAGNSLPVITDQYKVFFQPPLQSLPWGFPPSISAPPSYQPQIDPALARDEWSFADSSSIHFLSSLTNALSTLYPPIPNNISVQDAFKMHLNYLDGPATTPSFYHNMKTFWLPSAPMYFSLTSSTTSPQLPAPDYRFFFWDPHPLVFNGIQCPTCSQPLVNKGRIQSGPIKIYDLERPYYIVAAEYACSSSLCPTSGQPFASTDSSIMKNLPLKLREEFRVVLLERGDKSLEGWFNGGGVGVSRALWDMVRTSLMVGTNKAGILEVLRYTQCGLPDLPIPLPPPPPPPAGQHGSDIGQQRQGDNEHLQVKEDNAEEEEESEEESEEEDDDNSESLAEEDEAAILERAENILPIMKANAAIQAAAAAVVAQHQQSVTSPNPPLPNLNGNPNINPNILPPPTATPAASASAPAPAPPPPPQSVSHPHTPAPFYGLPIFPGTPFSPFPYPFLPHPSANQPPPGHPQYFQPPHTPAKRSSSTTGDNGGGKRMRHCCKCGHNECKGKGGRSFCQNACQDCGKLECRGRNSRRPDKKCSEAWD